MLVKIYDVIVEIFKINFVNYVFLTFPLGLSLQRLSQLNTRQVEKHCRLRHLRNLGLLIHRLPSEC